MAITVWRYGLCYFPAPKAANTTIKHALHEVKTGQSFRGDVMPDGTRKHIHQVYKTPKFNSVDHQKISYLLRFAVIRDPVERILSAWSNRVVFHKELSAQKVCLSAMKEQGLQVDPDLSTFIDRLLEYREVKGSIRIHTDPLVDFLGYDAAYFHLLFDIRNLSRLSNFIELVVGRKIKLRHMQSGGPKVTRADLTQEQVRRLESLYAEDYHVFGDAFGRAVSGAAGVAKGARSMADRQIADGRQ